MKLKKISALLVSALILSGTFASCSDDDVKNHLQMGSGTLETSSYNRLSFNWDKVEGATQYGCELYDEKDEVVDAKVTNARTIQFGGLTASTDYTLKVYAYAEPYGKSLTSEPLILTGRTDDIIVLSTPQQLAYDRLSNNLTFSWQSVSEAKGYSYSLTKDGEEYSTGSTTDTSVTFKNLETATYVFNVTATTDKGGYADSANASIEYVFEWEDPIDWTVNGSYYSEYLDQSWETTLIAYKDGSYTIKKWYNVDGYDFDFSIDKSDPDDMFRVPDDMEWDDGYPVAYTGRTSSPKSLLLYIWDNFCEINLDERYICLCVFYTGDWNYDYFTWEENGSTGGDDTEDIDLAGTYTMTTTGISYMEDDDATATPINFSETVEITAENGNSYSFPALYFGQWGDKMTVKANFTNRTLTVQPKDYYGYTLASEASASTAITGKINSDGSLTFDDFTAWWGGYTYIEDGKVTFTPVAK